MGARNKLNSAYINGSLILGGIIGLGCQSLIVFIVATLFFIGTSYYNKDIR